MGLIGWSASFLRPHRRRVALLVALLLVEVGLGALQPWPLKIVVDYVLDGRPLPDPVAGWIASAGVSRLELLVLVVGAGVLIQIVNHVVSAYGTQVQVETGQRMVYELRYRLFDHLQALGLTHHLKTGTGDAVYRIDVDAYSIENLVMSGLLPLATSLATLLVMFAILLRLDVTVALLSLSVVPPLYVCLRYYTSRIVDREERVKELESRLIERLYETFAAIRLVKGFAREAYEAARYRAAGERTRAARVELTWRQSLFAMTIGVITILGTALVLIVGGLHVMQGQMTVGSLIVVVAYLGAVYGPLSSIAHTTGLLQGAVAGARRVRAILARAPETADAPDAIDAAGIRGEVRFEGVGFTYPDGTRVLQGIDLEAKPGRMIALVGTTGSGKTTLVSLIPRFYDASEGRVLVDGVDLRRYRLQSLRDRIAIVLQDPILLSGTIADNLRYGRLDATDAQVEEAARAADAHRFISALPEQYQTQVAPGGGGLSGGERQRLNVARAILKNAPILILDEPTSSLDAISDETVFTALRGLRPGRTTIVIAHRLSTVRDADCILVLDGGRIAAQGTHDELLQTSALYRRMWKRLSEGRSLDDAGDVGGLVGTARP
jgi:ATP-binding cassette subfamily B protein/subfamily B ATP-binding cassette protein MsbA